LHPHETSHPGLFRCVRRNSIDDEGQEVIIKVAPTQHPPKSDLWEILPELRHPNVVRTFRTIEENGLFFEIQEFCHGGSLATCVGDSRITSEWICDHFVPEVTEGLKYLHSKEMVHRDIKPANLYLRENDINGTIVLGDFDISSVLLSHRTSRNTNRMAGTWAYTAPEAFPRFVGDGDGAAARITRAADYYSLGITIIELMTGTTSLHSCGLPDLYDFYLAGGRVELPDAPARLLLLLKGLLVRNRHERWTGPEVDRWLAGKNVRTDMQAVINDQRFSLAKTTRPFELALMQAVDLPSLAAAMEKNPEEAKSHLLESDLMTQWIANQDAAVAHKVERTREIYRHQPDLALYRCIDVAEYGRVSSLSEWGPLLANAAATERHLLSGPVTDFELMRMEAWLELKTKPNPALAAKIAEIRQRPIAIRFEELAFLFDRKLPYSGQISAFLNLRLPPESRRGGQTPKEVADEAFGVGADWEKSVPQYFRAGRDRWQSGYLEAWLRQRGSGELANKAATAASLLKGNLDHAFDTFLRHLDPWAEKPQVVFDEEPLSNRPAIEYGTEATLVLTYHTVGPGFPLGAVRLEDAPGQVSLDTFQLHGRKGRITVTFRPRAPLVGGGDKEVVFRIQADRGNYWILDDGVPVRFQTVFPLRVTISRMVVGAVLGAVTLGGARLFAAIPLRQPVTFAGIIGNPPPVYEHGVAVPPPNEMAYAVGAFLCLAGIYAAFRLWLEAYKGIRK
jgi:serine/threonine protein kinase